MKKVITYGTYDLFHEGHYNLLKRAKDLGDYLIVGVTTHNYDESRGKLNVQDSLMERIKNVKDTGLADEIIIEEFEGQKVQDILRHEVDIFAIGSDWEGKFDYLKEHCNVIYLERTKGISSTQLRESKNKIIKIGVVGYGRIANRFIAESKYVSGHNVEGIFGRNLKSAQEFCNNHQLNFASDDYIEFLKKIDAVYIASPHLSHFEYAKQALNNGKHVLCEKPLVLSKNQYEELLELAIKKNLVIMEAIKTAYSPGFIRLMALAKSGVIGKIKNVDATFTKLIEDKNCREFDHESAGGSFTELGTYNLLAIIKLLGDKIENVQHFKYVDIESEVDLYTKTNLIYKDAIATSNVGIGVKSEGHLIISGTKGYIYVPAPWWKTEYFELRFENSSNNKKYFYKFEGDGLRYEIAEFLNSINNNKLETYKLTFRESMKIIEIIDDFLEGKNTIEL